MSKIKIYDGVVIDMATSNILKEGKISYINADEVAYTKGGDKTQVTNTGVASEFKPQITGMLNTASDLYGSGKLGAVAGLTPEQIAAQNQAKTLAGQQIGMEGDLATLASKPVNLSGMRTAASLEAQKALGINAANAGRAGGLGGSRQMLNQQGISNDLAASFAGIDQQAQAAQFNNMQGALAAQGGGAKTLSQLGAATQQQAQNEADSAYKGLQQYASVFGAAAPKETKTTSSGGK
tara:strand:- start:4107 stop:4817 length:711 start_codon:yes stop_codon:yes gene_type:complete